MKKSFVTVAWSVTVQVEVPEGISAEDLNESELANDIIFDAGGDIDWKAGQIIDVRDEF